MRPSPGGSLEPRIRSVGKKMMLYMLLARCQRMPLFEKKRMPNTFDLYLHAFSASWAPIAPLAAPETGW